jgi:Uma2 family endonuclease
MADPQPLPFISKDEYLTGEPESSVRHEYVNGQIYAMARSSDKHSLINSNANAILNQALPDKCEIFIADMKVRIQTRQDLMFYYPDVMVCCEADDNATYHRKQPCLIIEVLSLSTERQDRFEKFWSYRQIPTLQEYLLLNQSVQEATLESVDLEIPLDALYRRVKLS